MTAQQVEDGSGSLKDYALDARERSREHARQATTVEQGLYIACLVRQEGGPWRSGSTYLVSLTPDGRVFIHAKDMALSGRLLNPLIYAEILTALGVSPADLANLASPDPGTRASAFAAVIATLSQEPDAPFDATAPRTGPAAGAYPVLPATPASMSRPSSGLRSCCSPDSISTRLTWLRKRSITATRPLPPGMWWTAGP